MPEQRARPYDFVPVSDDRPRSKVDGGHSAVEGGRMTADLKLCYRVLTVLHVGTGLPELGDGNKLPALYRPTLRTARYGEGGKTTRVPVIPASSLKGAVRSIYEALTGSCVLLTDVPEFKKDMCRVRERDNTLLCPACLLFGAMRYQGRISFEDAEPVELKRALAYLPALWQPRPKERKRYFDKNGRPKGRKFYRHGRVDHGDDPVEVWHAGSVFEVRVHLSSITAAQLGVLLLALGLPNPDGRRLTLKLGGHKPSCCGSVELCGGAHEPQLHVTDPLQRWAAGRFASADAEVQADPAHYIARTGDLLNKDAYDRLYEILSYERWSTEQCGYVPEEGRPW